MNDRNRALADERYYQAAPPRSVGARLMRLARDRMYADFLRLCRPASSDTILDLGASDVLNEGANALERLHPWPERITAAGLGAAIEFQAAFPKVRYVKVQANARLPFGDHAFDIAVSNAVLEHVGSEANQRFFLEDLMRVSRRVFLTAPNGLFPVEHHTAVPLLHWWRPSFAAACRVLGKTEWLDPANLMLVRRGRLQALAPPGRRVRIGVTGLPLGPFSSNLYLFIDQA